MRKLTPYFLSLAFCLTALKSDDLPALFTNRLARAQITFNPPENYTGVPLIKNGQMHYEYAMRSPDKSIEIRYSVMPLDSVFIQFDSLKKEKNQMGGSLGPNSLYTGAFLAIISNISDRIKRPQILPFTKEAAKNEFNADGLKWHFVKLVKNLEAAINIAW